MNRQNYAPCHYAIPYLNIISPAIIPVGATFPVVLAFLSFWHSGRSGFPIILAFLRSFLLLKTKDIKKEAEQTFSAYYILNI
jgi:hypothetical protein